MRILYLILNPKGEETFQQILAGELPSDRMYGILELKRLGYDVTFKCMRPQGTLKNFIGFLNKKYGLNLTGLDTLSEINNYDIIVVNGPFSTLITMACRLKGKKIVYLDTILRSPRNKFRKTIYKINIILSNGTIMYSKAQMKQCAEWFKVSLDCFKLLPFAIDVSFYRNTKDIKKTTKPYVLSVGRDQARDYKTLVNAMNGLNVNLKLVTLPYLLQEVDLNSDWIEVLENVSYEELYRLYSEALFVVIPLKKWGVAYSSGTRALLEAKTMGKTVIASRSLPLEEYMGQEEGVFFAESEDVDELRKHIVRLLENQDECKRYEATGREIVKTKFNTDVFASAFGNYLSCLFVD